MDVSAASLSASLQAVSDLDRRIAVMKTSHDVQEAQAQALIELVRQAPALPPHVGNHLNVVA